MTTPDDTFAQDITAFAHILGVSPGVLQGTMARVRALPPPLSRMRLTVELRDRGAAGREFRDTGMVVVHLPQRAPVLMLEIAAMVSDQRPRMKASYPLAAVGATVCGINAGPQALAVALQNLAANLTGRADILARTRYKHDAEREGAKRDQTVRDIRAGIVGLDTIRVMLLDPDRRDSLAEPVAASGQDTPAEHTTVTPTVVEAP